MTKMDCAAFSFQTAQSTCHLFLLPYRSYFYLALVGNDGQLQFVLCITGEQANVLRGSSENPIKRQPGKSDIAYLSDAAVIVDPPAHNSPLIVTDDKYPVCNFDNVFYAFE